MSPSDIAGKGRSLFEPDVTDRYAVLLTCRWDVHDLRRTSTPNRRVVDDGPLTRLVLSIARWTRSRRASLSPSTSRSQGRRRHGPGHAPSGGDPDPSALGSGARELSISRASRRLRVIRRGVRDLLFSAVPSQSP